MIKMQEPYRRLIKDILKKDEISYCDKYKFISSIQYFMSDEISLGEGYADYGSWLVVYRLMNMFF